MSTHLFQRHFEKNEEKSSNAQLRLWRWRSGNDRGLSLVLLTTGSFSIPTSRSAKSCQLDPAPAKAGELELHGMDTFFENRKTVKPSPQGKPHEICQTPNCLSARSTQGRRCTCAPASTQLHGNRARILSRSPQSTQLPNLWLTKCENLTVECSGSLASTVFAPFWNDFLKTAWSS